MTNATGTSSDPPGSPDAGLAATPDPAPRLCAQCAKHDAIRALLHDYGEDGHSCTFCGQPRRTVDTSLRAFVQLVKSLVRYFFSEWEYNQHHGGDGLERLLQTENPILVHGNEAAIEAVALRVFANPYEEPNEGVTLFAGYLDGQQQLPLLRALSDTDAPLVARLRADLQRVNHFVVEGTATSALRPLVGRISRIIPAGYMYYRARIGFSQRFLYGNDLEQEGFVPYRGASIGAPPPTTASPGRANRQGVAFLYLASTIETALAEVRPHPGHIVSIGAFAARRALCLANFHDISIANYASCDARLDDFVFLQSINRELSEPITPEERSRYVLGQLIADVSRQLGFDGVQYRSSVSDGYNVCIFDPNTFLCQENQVHALRVDRLAFSSTALPAFVEPPPDHFKLFRGR